MGDCTFSSGELPPPAIAVTNNREGSRVHRRPEADGVSNIETGRASEIHTLATTGRRSPVCLVNQQSVKAKRRQVKTSHARPPKAQRENRLD